MDTMVSLYKLSVFCQVVEHGTITRAAQELGLTQPVVSEHVRMLERRLESLLFERRGRRLELTESGRVTYEWARDVVRRTREAEVLLRDLADNKASTIRVASCTASAAALLPDIVLAFQHSHPRAVVALNHLASDAAVASVRAGQCDFGLVSYADECLGENRDDEIAVEWVHRERLVAVCAPSRREAG
ncbi:LysR family transcriptional regulator, partial [Pseudonocardia pini]|uniref:LysR family transcriptional regulator n=1 Tax=Pseudonocardia pini TaxID=2758030 RepID=UPI0015F0D8F7